MGLNVSKGNMYDFITHTWNIIKGECYHDCSYCYMKRWGKLNPVRFDEKELKTDLGKDNFIFVGSSNDMFAENISDEWILRTFDHLNKFDNKYFFQTKDVENFNNYIDWLPENSVLCTTVESNRNCFSISVAPETYMRTLEMFKVNEMIDCYITIEPIIDFDLIDFVKMLKQCNPIQINIGADSGSNNLPEPPKEKILELISELEKFTKVKRKSNLKRLLK